MNVVRQQQLDCVDAFCPEPLLRTITAVNGMESGDSLTVWVRTPGAKEDIERWATKSKDLAIESVIEEDRIRISIRRI